MKISLLITEDGAQVTLTPANSTEEAILGFLHQVPTSIEAKQAGEFGLTQGGYFREFDHRPNTKSTMLVIRKAIATEAPQQEGSSIIPETAHDHNN